MYSVVPKLDRLYGGHNCHSPILFLHLICCKPLDKKMLVLTGQLMEAIRDQTRPLYIALNAEQLLLESQQ